MARLRRSLDRLGNWLLGSRTRILIRGAFVLLICVLIAGAIVAIRWGRQEAIETYTKNLETRLRAIRNQLTSLDGQILLANLVTQQRSGSSVRVFALPLNTLNIWLRSERDLELPKACTYAVGNDGAICAGLIQDRDKGAFVFLQGSFRHNAIETHTQGAKAFDAVHRLKLQVAIQGNQGRWLATFQPPPPPRDGSAASARTATRWNITGYRARTDWKVVGGRHDREVGGRLLKTGRCLPGAGEALPPEAPFPCVYHFALRLPVDPWRYHFEPWPPKDLQALDVSLELLGPKEADGRSPVLFSTAQAAPIPLYSIDSLRNELATGEELRIVAPTGQRGELVINSRPQPKEASALEDIARRIIVTAFTDHGTTAAVRPLAQSRLNGFELALLGDVANARDGWVLLGQRIVAYLLLLLAVVLVSWAVIEIYVLRPVSKLTRRTHELSKKLQVNGPLPDIGFAGLVGRDELGVLATGLRDLLERVRADIVREQRQIAQSKEMLKAIGHEIRSPLQNLVALHGDGEDRSRPYVDRMLRAVELLYSAASPETAFVNASPQLTRTNLVEFLQNATEIGIDNIDYRGPKGAVWAMADEGWIEDVIMHVLNNAVRFREPDSPISIALAVTERGAEISIRNRGPAIPEDKLDTIFEYGVSLEPPGEENKGQGLFVARSYMAKMDGSIEARNMPGGVEFLITLPLSSGRNTS
ncbi:sensor histidine kinase [Chitinimonas lacunae]|uniref:histidine kinase n=1 Tax=Chitinimonas lacunae TaxID=1963018 RepID=A0ABV8MWE7_9NEIS